MKSRWNPHEASAIGHDQKALRVYTSRLLGSDPDLVLHGGGNTSVKLTEQDSSGQDVELLFVKGSGQDLATIEADGFAPVPMETLLRLVQRESLSDSELVNQQRADTTKPGAPDASVEAITHAIIPFRFVDHTHADSIIAITNTPNSQQRIKECFGDRLLVIPYVMPGFVLARKIFEMTQGLDWSQYEGMVLMNHGLVTFGNDARTSYEATIKLVDEAEQYLAANGADQFAWADLEELEYLTLAGLRKVVSEKRGAATIAKWDTSAHAAGYARLENIADIGTRGPVTPDHSIRTKRIPMLLGDDVQESVDAFAENYQQYFQQHKSDGLTCLEPSPRWVIGKDLGLVSFGTSYKESVIVADIAQHTARVVQQAEALGGWTPLSSKEVFDVEYWELEQAKLNREKAELPLQGKIALVTGAASEIGKATAEQLHAQGATVVATDIAPEIQSLFDKPDLVGEVCDVSNHEALKSSVNVCVSTFGGLDIVVSNACVFCQGKTIDELTVDSWEQELDLNLNQHKDLMQASVPFLKLGIDPTFILIGTRNVAAPTARASAFTAAQTAVKALMRDAAQELGKFGIHVETIRPVSPDEVAQIVCIAAGKTFNETNGAQASR